MTKWVFLLTNWLIKKKNWGFVFLVSQCICERVARWMTCPSLHYLLVLFAISFYLLRSYAMVSPEIWLVEVDFPESSCRGERGGMNISLMRMREKVWDFLFFRYRFLAFRFCVPNWKALLRYLLWPQWDQVVYLVIRF